MNVVAVRSWGSEFFDHVERHVEAFQRFPPHTHRSLVEAYTTGALVTDLRDDALGGLIEPWLTEEGASSFYRQFAQADERFTAEVEPKYGEVRCPTRIVWGEDDPWIPLVRGRELHERMADADFETIPAVGHLPQLEAPQAVPQRLLTFI